MKAARRLLLLLPLVLAAPLSRGQAADVLPKKEVSEKASAGFAKLQPLLDAKDYAGALALIEPLLAASAPTSFDAYALLQLKSQVLLAQNRYAEAIAPLERAHALAEGNANFVEPKSFLERLQLLAQLHYQVAAEQKAPAAQRAGFEKALGYVRAWMARGARPTADIRMLAASLLYQLGTSGGKTDPVLLREAVTHAEEALLLAPKPATQTRLFLVACRLQLGESDRAAELLELLVERDPGNGSAWAQLHALYLSLAGAASDPAAARTQNLRALLALERAQANGFLASPKDHYTRAALLFNLGQLSRAAVLLEAGLAEGTLENSRRNWDLLAAAYQQTGREEKAVETLGRAVKAFPADGALEFSLAQLLYGSGRVAEAYERGRSALAKPGLEKPGQANLYLAYLAYELQRYDEAARWAAAARAAGDAPADNLKRLERAIAEALASREAANQS